MLNARFTPINRGKGSQNPLIPNATYIAKVVRTSGGVYVNVPNLSPNQIFGPCKVFTKYPVVGESVLVGFLEGKRSNLVLLGSGGQNYRLSNVDTPTLDKDAANKKYVDDQILALQTQLTILIDLRSPNTHTH